MILKTICDISKPGSFDFMRERYYQKDVFEPTVKGANLRHGYDGRFGTSRYWNIKSQRRPEDEDGLVGF